MIAFDESLYPKRVCSCGCIQLLGHCQQVAIFQLQMCHDVIEISYSMCHITADVPIIIHKHFIVTEYGCLWHHKPQDMSVGVAPTGSQHGMGTLNLQHDRFYLVRFLEVLLYFGPMFARNCLVQSCFTIFIGQAHQSFVEAH